MCHAVTQPIQMFVVFSVKPLKVVSQFLGWKILVVRKAELEGSRCWWRSWGGPLFWQAVSWWHGGSREKRRKNRKCTQFSYALLYFVYSTGCSNKRGTRFQGVYIIRWDFNEDFMFQRVQFPLDRGRWCRKMTKINLKCRTYWSCYMAVNSNSLEAHQIIGYFVLLLHISFWVSTLA
jgi:hypothetical protein